VYSIAIGPAAIIEV